MLISDPTGPAFADLHPPCNAEMDARDRAHRADSAELDAFWSAIERGLSVEAATLRGFAAYDLEMRHD